MFQTNFSLMYWNVSGIYSSIAGDKISKFDDEYLFKLALSHDIVCLVETHLNKDDKFSLEGYKVTNFKRPKSSNERKASGGISVALKDSIREGVKFLGSRKPTDNQIPIRIHSTRRDSSFHIANPYQRRSPSSTRVAKQKTGWLP